MLISPATLMAFIPSILLFYVVLQYRRRRRLPPGPRGLPVLGNVLQLDPVKPHHTLASWSGEFNHVFSLSLIGTRVVVLNSEEAIREALVTRSADFAGRPHTFRLTYLMNADNVTFAKFSPKWVTMKKAAMNALKINGSSVWRLEEISAEIIDDLVTRIERRQGRPFDPLDDLHHAVSSIMSSLLYGKRSSDKALKDLLDLDTIICGLAAPNGPGLELDLFPWLRFLGTKNFMQLKLFKESIDSWFDDKFEDLKMGYDPDDIRSILDAMLDQQRLSELEAREGDFENPLTDDVIKMMCRDFLFGGVQTTSRLLYAFVAIVTARPELQIRAKKEISMVIGDRPVRLADKGSIPYIDAFIMETLRYISHLPLAIPHETTRDTTIMDHDVPKGTQVWVNLWGLHHREDYWSDPWELKPERFLDENGQLIPPDHPNRKRFMAFGAGRRVCMGETLAKNRAFLMVTSLLQRLTFLPESHDQLPHYDPREYTLGIVLQPPPYKVTALLTSPKADTSLSEFCAKLLQNPQRPILKKDTVLTTEGIHICDVTEEPDECPLAVKVIPPENFHTCDIIEEPNCPNLIEVTPTDDQEKKTVVDIDEIKIEQDTCSSDSVKLFVDAMVDDHRPICCKECCTKKQRRCVMLVNK